MEQGLRERGLFVPGLTTDGNCIRQKQKVHRGDKYNMRLVLSKVRADTKQKPHTGKNNKQNRFLFGPLKKTLAPLQGVAAVHIYR
jgi:hypothetical protein